MTQTFKTEKVCDEAVNHSIQTVIDKQNVNITTDLFIRNS
jgi:hypothetical protein